MTYLESININTFEGEQNRNHKHLLVRRKIISIAFFLVLLYCSSCTKNSSKELNRIDKKVDSLLVDFLSDTSRPNYYLYKNSGLPISKQLVLCKSIRYPEIDLTLDFYLPFDSHILTEVVVVRDSFNCALIPFYPSSYSNIDSVCKCTLPSLNKDFNSAFKLFDYKKDDFHIQYGLDFKSIFVDGIFSNLQRWGEIFSSGSYFHQNDVDYITNNTKSFKFNGVDTLALGKMVEELLGNDGKNFDRAYFFSNQGIIFSIKFTGAGVNLKSINSENYREPLVF